MSIFVCFIGLLWSCLFGTYANAQIGLENPKLDRWKKLMLYQGHEDSIKSAVDSKTFFLAPDGRTNWQHELLTQIEFFKRTSLEAQVMQCKFPARYKLLSEIFNFPRAEIKCPGYAGWKIEYAPTYLSLFYAGQYLSSPASTFGHAFLLLGSAQTDEYAQTTFNFAAQIPPEEGALSYAFKGIFGQFKASISTLPYFHRLEEYSNMESRDLWEYRLNLTPEELDFVSDYLYEMTETAQFDYYFFKQNCATVLLWILQATRPSIEIKTSNPFYVTPVETTVIATKMGLVERVIFHPPLMERLRAKISEMNHEEQKTFHKSVRENVVSDLNNKLILEAYLDHLNIQRHRNAGVLPESLELPYRETLLARAKISEKSFEFPAIAIPKAPDTQHPPMLLNLSFLKWDGQDFGHIRIRPAIHGLLDKADGYLPNSALEFLSLDMNFNSSNKARLEKFEIAHMTNFRPVSLYEKSFSWNFEASLRRNEFDSQSDEFFGEISGGIGYSKNAFSPILIYGFLTSTLRSYTPSPLGPAELGTELGTVFTSGKFKTHGAVSYVSEAGLSKRSQFWKQILQASYELSQAWSFETRLIQWINVETPSEKSDKVQAGLNYYF